MIFGSKKFKSDDINELLKEARPTIGAVFFFSAILNLLMLVPPIYMMQVFDKVVQSKSLETLAMLVLIVLWMFLIMWLLEMIRSRIMGRVCSRIESRLTDRLYLIIFQHASESGEKASSQPVGELMQIRQFLTGHTFFALLDAPWVIFFILTLFLFNLWYGLFAIGMLIIYAIIALLNHKATKNIIEDSNRYFLESSYIMNSQIQNPEVAQTMGLYQNLKHKWMVKNDLFLKAQRGLGDQESIFGNLSKTLKLAQMTMMVSLGAILIVDNEITAGMLIAGGLLMARVIMPIDAAIHSWKPMDQFFNSLESIDRFLADYAKMDDKTSLPEPAAHLILEKVSLIPPTAEDEVIKDISLQFLPGQVIGVVGPSASGKSSLARALVGIWKPTEGHVRLDHADLSQWDSEDLGKYIGYLPQETALFEGTVSENISRFGELDDEKVVSAAKLAGVHEMILHLPEGYDTQVGNLGVALSGGQRQRIALARAFYDRPKLVVLDEPNANLDESGEHALMRAIVNMKMAGSIVVVITHRPKVLEVTDVVINIVEGRLNAMDTFDKIPEKMVL